MRTTNIFVLHSLNGDTLEIWGKDVKQHYDNKSIKVTMPKFPIRAESRYEKFRDILKVYLESGELNENTIIVAHSIGNAYFLRFSEEMKFTPKAYVAVAPGAVYDYPTTRTDYIVDVKKQSVVKQNAFDYVKNMDCEKYVLYSDEDDNNIEKFTRFVDDTGCKGIYLKGYNHFDGYHDVYKVPELIEILDKLV